MSQTEKWTFDILAEFPVLLEGPAWDGRGLLFTEIANNRIHRYDPATGKTRIFRESTSEANGLMFDTEGKLYACEGGGRRVVVYEGERTKVLAASFERQRLNSPNDLAIDASGRIWFTDPRYGNRDGLELDHESVYRLDPVEQGNWPLTRVTFDTTRPNGILVSPDGQTLYVAESPHDEGSKRELRAYPVNGDGSLGDYQVLHDFSPHRGIDGMCLDIEGNIIATAGSDAGGPGPLIYVFNPTGEVMETHTLPVDYPTNCTFGDADLKTLYVTTGSGYLLRTRTERQGQLWYPVVKV
ncbi:SMP-30/gluconolactonase/LRE family protein [soil metagenome]